MRKLIYLLAFLLTLNSYAQYPALPLAEPELIREIKMGDIRRESGIVIKEFSTSWSTEGGSSAFIVRNPGVIKEVNLYFDGEHGNPTVLPVVLIKSIMSCDIFNATSGYGYPTIEPTFGDSVLAEANIYPTTKGKHWEIEENFRAFSLYGWYVLVITNPISASGRLSITVKESLDIKHATTELLDINNFKEKKIKDDGYGPDASFTSYGDSSQVLPVDTGSSALGQVSIRLDSQMLESPTIHFDVRHNVSGLTKITLHSGNAAAALNTPPLYTLRNTGNKFRETTVSADLANFIYSVPVGGTVPESRDLFVVFHSNSFPDGEIRGQFIEDENL